MKIIIAFGMAALTVLFNTGCVSRAELDQRLQQQYGYTDAIGRDICTSGEFAKDHEKNMREFKRFQDATGERWQPIVDRYLTAREESIKTCISKFRRDGMYRHINRADLMQTWQHHNRDIQFGRYGQEDSLYNIAKYIKGDLSNTAYRRLDMNRVRWAEEDRKARAAQERQYAIAKAAEDKDRKANPAKWTLIDKQRECQDYQSNLLVLNEQMRARWAIVAEQRHSLKQMLEYYDYNERNAIMNEQLQPLIREAQQANAEYQHYSKLCAGY
ncbi:hypothetical protein [Aeromonas allosaccharophila]|uniref:hypothetical protein n=1 Tax=Aeromonas allosaccharophila TaxID=656 RepID=UPI0005A96164|nr:hypothetical protein [Aeromonas allosaccharophila]